VVRVWQRVVPVVDRALRLLVVLAVPVVQQAIALALRRVKVGMVLLVLITVRAVVVEKGQAWMRLE
jgi:hypothetical protein